MAQKSKDRRSVEALAALLPAGVAGLSIGLAAADANASTAVSDAPAAPMAKNGIFFSLTAAFIARLTPVLEPPSSIVRPFVSAHSRNLLPPMSGLF